MSVINNPSQWQMHWDYARHGLGMVYPRYSPLHWRDYAPAALHRGGLGDYQYRPHPPRGYPPGLGIIFPHNQNWQTSRLPWSLALKNTVSTGVSFDTPSGAIAERQRWARRGFQGLSGYGPRIQYPGGAGMDGMGCGCGCGGNGSCGGGDWTTGLLCFAGAAAALWFLNRRGI